MKQRAAELAGRGQEGRQEGRRPAGTSSTRSRRWRPTTGRSPSASTSPSPRRPRVSSPKTWYGMPAYANEDGKVVLFFQDSGKFKYRYATLGFQDAATSTTATCGRRRTRSRPWTAAVEKKIVALVKKAVR